MNWNKALMPIALLAIIVGASIFALGQVGLLSQVRDYGGAGNATTAQNLPPGTVLQQTQTYQTPVDLKTTVRQSIATSTGVKNTIAGTMTYYLAGADGAPVSVQETTTVTPAGGISSSTDPNPDQNLVGIFTNTSVYTTKVTFKTPFASSYPIDVEADIINTPVVECQNSSSGNWQTTGMEQTLAADQAVTITCRARGNTANAVGRFAPALIGLNYTNTEFTPSTTYALSGGNPASVADLPTGIMGGYQRAYSVNVGNVVGFDSSKTFQIVLQSASGVNPNSNVTFQLADLGVYTKNVHPIAFNGYQNPDTLADTGGANQNFTIVVR